MSRPGQEFKPLLPLQDKRPRAAFFGPAGFLAIIRDQFTITTWLCFGAAAQAFSFLLAGRYACLPALSVLLYRAMETLAVTLGWRPNPYLSATIPHKFSAQFPDSHGHYGAQSAASEVVVFIIGTRYNHPLGSLAPGAKAMSDFFVHMVQELEAHAEDYGFLGMTTYLNASDRSTSSEIMNIGYFRGVAGLHAFAHGAAHRRAWDWWTQHTKRYPHLCIFHETYRAPKGCWENVYDNCHAGGITSTTFRVVDEGSGEVRWASPVVDASKGLLRTAAGRLGRGQRQEHDFDAD